MMDFELMRKIESIDELHLIKPEKREPISISVKCDLCKTEHEVPSLDLSGLFSPIPRSNMLTLHMYNREVGNMRIYCYNCICPKCAESIRNHVDSLKVDDNLKGELNDENTRKNC